jgi:hypothetical protein
MTLVQQKACRFNVTCRPFALSLREKTLYVGVRSKNYRVDHCPQKRLGVASVMHVCVSQASVVPNPKTLFKRV